MRRVRTCLPGIPVLGDDLVGLRGLRAVVDEPDRPLRRLRTEQRGSQHIGSVRLVDPSLRDVPVSSRVRI